MEASPPDPPPGALPWTLLGVEPPNPVIGEREVRTIGLQPPKCKFLATLLAITSDQKWLVRL